MVSIVYWSPERVTLRGDREAWEWIASALQPVSIANADADRIALAKRIRGLATELMTDITFEGADTVTTMMSLIGGA